MFELCPAYRSGSNSPRKTDYQSPCAGEINPWETLFDPGGPLSDPGEFSARSENLFECDHVRDELLPLRCILKRKHYAVRRFYKEQLEVLSSYPMMVYLVRVCNIYAGGMVGWPSAHEYWQSFHW